MSPCFVPNFRNWLFRSLFFVLLSFAAAPQLLACDGSDTVIDGLVDNGDGTYTITVTITIAGVDWRGGIFGGTRGFYFTTDVPIVSVTPPSFTSLNGTTLPAVITGTQVRWGDPFSGPFFVAPSDITQSFTFVLVVSGRPMTWTAGGQELGNCIDSGTFPCPLPALTVTLGDQTICEGTTATLSVIAQGEDLLTWSTGETSPTIIVSPTTTTVYTVTADNDCGSVVETITVTVDPLPLMTPDVPIQSICQGPKR